jgi:16S rRNA (guanine527-N7)-methyltransferase
MSTLAELASPLLRDAGVLVAWKGRRDPEEEAELQRAAERLAMEPVEIRHVGPYAGSEHRHLHTVRKSGPTPQGVPRRPGMAKKRPYG